MSGDTVRIPRPGDRLAISHWRHDELWLTVGTLQGVSLDAIDGRLTYRLRTDPRRVAAIRGETVEHIEHVTAR